MGSKALILWDSSYTAGADDPVGNPPAVGFEKTNINNYTYNFWKPSLTGLGGFAIGIFPSRAIDSICIAGHNLFTDQITFTLEAWDGAVFNPIFAAFIPPSDDPIFLTFGSTQATGDLYRFTTNQANPGGNPAEIAVLFIGPRYEFTKPLGLPFTPTPLAYDDGVKRTHNDSREWRGRFEQFSKVMTALKQIWLDPDHARGPWRDFMEHARANPFFFLWDPINFPLEAAYGWLPKIQMGKQKGTFLLESNNEFEGFTE